MYLAEVSLIGFRSYRTKAFPLPKKVTVFVGENAVGKTNILEGIHLLSTGDSFRAEKIEDMILWNEELAHVTGKVYGNESQEPDELRVTMTRGMVQGKRTQKRRFVINGLGRRKQDFQGLLATVLFRPEDLTLLEGSPSERRAYLDNLLTLTDSEYRRSLAAYQKALRQRNRLLDLIRERKAPPTVLGFWDQVLVREGEVLSEVRRRAIEAINAFEPLGGRRELVYRPSVITEARLKEKFEADVAVGHTLIGPHKDDFDTLSFEAGGRSKDVATFGSRGEQRMAVLWLKLAELALVTERTGERPLLLLDDIFSELDEKHGELVREIMNLQQTVVTTTSREEAESIGGAQVAELGKKEE